MASWMLWCTSSWIMRWDATLHQCCHPSYRGGWHAWNIGCMWNIVMDMPLECFVGKEIYRGVGLWFWVLGGSSTNQCYTWVLQKQKFPLRLPFILCTLSIVGFTSLNFCCNFFINKFCNLQKCLVIPPQILLHWYLCEWWVLEVWELWDDANTFSMRIKTIASWPLGW